MLERAARAAAPALPLGLVPDLTNEAYQASPGFSSSALRDFAQSPAHYFGRWRDPSRPRQVERLGGQLEGELAHCSSFEPDEFDVRYVTLPADAPARPTARQLKASKKSYSTLDAIDFWRGMDGANPHAVAFIKPPQREAAMRQGESVRRLPEVREAMTSGYPEISAYWIDPETGIYCRCRPDWTYRVHSSACIPFDLKTYDDASAAAFRRQILRKGYHLQDAHYSAGMAAAAELEVLAFVFIAVETSWPYVAQAHMLTPESRERAADQHRALLRQYARCDRDNEWPGYALGICQIHLPAWAGATTEED